MKKIKVTKRKENVEFIYEIELNDICKQLPELNLTELARQINNQPYDDAKIRHIQNQLFRKTARYTRQIGKEFTKFPLL